MSDSRRFKLFAQLIFKQFPPNKFKSVADIAGGKGSLQKSLKDLGYPEVITFDHRPKRISGIRYINRFFGDQIKQSFDLLVALHPDEATDVTIQEAIRRKVPFVVCPCCVKPTVLKIPPCDYRRWIHELRSFAERNGYSTETFQINITGKNQVLIGRLKRK